MCGRERDIVKHAYVAEKVNLQNLHIYVVEKVRTYMCSRETLQVAGLHVYRRIGERENAGLTCTAKTVMLCGAQ